MARDDGVSYFREVSTRGIRHVSGVEGGVGRRLCGSTPERPLEGMSTLDQARLWLRWQGCPRCEVKLWL